MERRSIRINFAEEDPPSVFLEKDNLEKIKAEQDELEKQKEKEMSEELETKGKNQNSGR